MKIALLQLNLTVGDLAGNARRIEAAVGESVTAGADLAVTSELALLGYPPRDLLLDRQVMAEAEAVATRLAHALKDTIPVLLGTAVASRADAGKPLHNAAVLLSEGTCHLSAAKISLPTYDVFDEDRYFEPALQAAPTLTVGAHQFGVSICEDAWSDQQFWPHPRYHRDPIAELAAGAADCLINLSSSPFDRDKQRLRERLLAHAARRHHLPILYVNQVGGNDELLFDGRSCAFDSEGRLLARAKAFAEDLLIVSIAEAGRVEPDLAGDAEIWEALVMGTRDYARKCGFKKGLVALSGGIDSALTLVIVAAALGAGNVLAVMMPSPYSSAGSIDDSLKLAAELGVETLKLPIEPAMSAFEHILEDSFAHNAPDVTEENLQARIRGTLVMALSNKWNRLVFTTGNKSETAVGYNTLYGCTAGALAVIADLYKGDVYALARWVNREREIIPEGILTKPPSAELRPDQRDQDTLPPYPILDAILRAHIEGGQTSSEIVAAGYEPATVERVLKLVRQAEFKRRQLPPGLRVTARAFGIGWQMPIARR